MSDSTCITCGKTFTSKSRFDIHNNKKIKFKKTEHTKSII